MEVDNQNIVITIETIINLHPISQFIFLSFQRNLGCRAKKFAESLSLILKISFRRTR